MSRIFTKVRVKRYFSINYIHLPFYSSSRARFFTAHGVHGDNPSQSSVPPHTVFFRPIPSQLPKSSQEPFPQLFPAPFFPFPTPGKSIVFLRSVCFLSKILHIPLHDFSENPDNILLHAHSVLSDNEASKAQAAIQIPRIPAPWHVEMHCRIDKNQFSSLETVSI